jgi:apolipoprotein D and lipocalin family protein
MKKLLIVALLSLVLISIFSECKSVSNKAKIDKSTVRELDIQRFLGTWYEIGRFDHSFERDLVGVTATYTQKKDGMIEVLNQGYKENLDGRLKSARGKAKLSGQPGQLKVSFFLFFYADYNVLELDQAGYQWALIGSSTPGYLWILARTPSISGELYEKILQKAADRGYDITRIYKVPQKSPGL